MLEDKIDNTELKQLMEFISSQYSKEEMDWFVSLAHKPFVNTNVEIKVLSNSSV